MAFAPRPPRPVEVVALSSAPGDSAVVRRSQEDARGRNFLSGHPNFRQRSRRDGERTLRISPRSARPGRAPAASDDAMRSGHTLGARPHSARARQYSPRSANGQSGTDRAGRSHPSSYCGHPLDSEEARKARRTVDRQPRTAHKLSSRKSEDEENRLVALHKPAHSLRDHVFVMHKSKPDDAMLQADGIMHSSWKGHDDPFSILSTEERLRQKLARKMRAASYTLGGQDWFELFSRYDTDHSGNLDFKEFIRAVRRDAAVGPETVTDGELRQVFDYIDTDKDHTIDANELQEFMARELRKDRDGSAKEQGATTARVQKFLAESIALERVVMRAKADLSSARVGILPKGEIVAVTHVAGNRMHVRRLRWNADLEQREENQDSGWVSERADGGSGRLLIEVLPRDEWTSRNYNEKALTERVKQLAAMRQMSVAYTAPGMLGSMQRYLQAQARELEREQERAKQLEVQRLTGSGAAPLRRSTVSFAEHEAAPVGAGAASAAEQNDRMAVVGHVHVSPASAGSASVTGAGASTADKAAMIAAKIIERCKEPDEVSALLGILESEPREQWATLLARRQF